MKVMFFPSSFDYRKNIYSYTGKIFIVEMITKSGLYWITCEEDGVEFRVAKRDLHKLDGKKLD